MIRKINQIHHHNTRSTEKAIYFLRRMNKSFSQKILSFRGTKLWKEIDNDIKSTHWVSFKKAYKYFFIAIVLMFIEYAFLCIILFKCFEFT